MKYLSVCSGIEAATVAWHPLGWRPWAFAEVDAFPSAVLAHHYPNTPNLGDMTRFQEWPDATVDVLVGGTPCQSFSVAGLRAGLADPRGNLMLVYGAIAARFRPRWLVWENVPGVLSSNSGRDFGTFLGMLGELGYGFAYRVLDAQFFGLAQRRKRVFVVGCLGDWRRAAAVLFDRASLRGGAAPSRQAGEGSAVRPAPRVERSRCLTPAPHADISPALKARDAKGPNSDGDGDGAILVPMVAHALRGTGFDASEDGTGRGTPLVPVAFDMTQVTSAANRSNPRPGDPCHPLAAGAHAPAIAFHAAQDPDVSGDITHPVGRNQGLETAAMIGAAVRRLTPRECERLQGFPDDYTAIPWRGKPADQCPDGPRYKSLGNSMAVPVMRWIGQRIDMVERLVPARREEAAA